jgi:plasmid maintenance system antidote protein VapI
MSLRDDMEREMSSRKLTDNGFATIIGVDPKTIRKLKQGRQIPNLETAHKIAVEVASVLSEKTPAQWGGIFKTAIKEQGWGIYELAKAVGTETNVINRALQGKCLVTTAYVIASALELSEKGAFIW